jgi:hypothetical protein
MDAAHKPTGAAATGVSFEVRPRVSLDRRSLRLELRQTADQLVAMDKVKTLDLASGKEVEVECPNIRKTSVTQTIQMADKQPILMPVCFRPADKDSKDKVWLLVARPFIWIEEEVQEVRKGGGDVTPQSVWDSEVPKEEVPPPPAPALPCNDDVKELLQAIITDVLTNPELKVSRELYGTAKDNTFTLVDDGKFSWPKELQPNTHGHRLVQVHPDPFDDQRRVLGVRLDKFDLKEKAATPFQSPIEICLFNAGGSANGQVIGGCTVRYEPKRIGKRWTVELVTVSRP